MIELEFHEKCVTEDNSKRYVRAETVIAQQTDYFRDATDMCGEVFSPTVSIEFEGLNALTDKSNHASLGHSYTLTMPHCFNPEQVDYNGDPRPLQKEDLLVVYSTWSMGEWHEVLPNCFELLPPEPNFKYGCSMPRLKVVMFEGGIVSVFSRKDQKPFQLVQMRAFLPARLNPLELSYLRVFACPLLPNELEMLKVSESHERGATVHAGTSKVISMRHCTDVDITLADVQGENHVSQHRRVSSKHVLDVKAETPDAAVTSVPADKVAELEALKQERLAGRKWKGAREHFMWVGTTVTQDFTFDPEEFMDAMRSKGIEVNEEDVNVSVKIHLEVDVTDKNLMMGMEHERRTHRGRKFAPRAYPFEVDVEIHAFQPPSAPLDFCVTSRNQTTVRCAWSLPTSWGGCALSHFEFELREITNKGVKKDWCRGLANARTMTGTYFGSVYEAEVRVRAFNLGTHKPGEWSEVVYLQVEKKEGLGKEAKVHEDKNFTTHAETGTGVIVQVDLKDFHMKPHVSKGVGEDWSEFEQIVGEMFVECGIYGGASGRLFDLTPKQVKEMVEGEQDVEGFDEEKPLMSLAIAGTWVLQTLAHHAENADDWIIYMNEIGSLVAGVGGVPEDGAVEPILRELIIALNKVYETLRQCDPDGMVTQQLKHKYEKSVKKQLKHDWAEALVRLKNEVSCHVMGIILYDRYKQWNMRQALTGDKVMRKMSTRRLSAEHHKASLDASEASAPK